MPAAKLHKVTHDARGNKYCGPSALSAITGQPTSLTAAVLRRVSGRPAIKGTFYHEIVSALEAFGFAAIKAPVHANANGSRPTLARFLKSLDKRKLYLICSGHHYRVVQGRRYVCGQTKEIVPLRQAPGRRSFVAAAWQIVPLVHPVRDTVAEVRRDEVAARKSQAVAAKARREIAKLHEAHPEIDVSVDVVERGYRHIWVTCQRLDDEGRDPFEGDHIVTTWDEALERAQRYAEVLKGVAS